MNIFDKLVFIWTVSHAILMSSLSARLFSAIWVIFLRLSPLEQGCSVASGSTSICRFFSFFYVRLALLLSSQFQIVTLLFYPFHCPLLPLSSFIPIKYFYGKVFPFSKIQKYSLGNFADTCCLRRPSAIFPWHLSDGRYYLGKKVIPGKDKKCEINQVDYGEERIWCPVRW